MVYNQVKHYWRGKSRRKGGIAAFPSPEEMQEYLLKI